MASKLYGELPTLYTSLIRNKVSNPFFLSLTAIELYYFELFCTICQPRQSYSTYVGFSKLSATQFQWNEKLISMEYVKRVNVFIHPLTKLFLQNLLYALDLKLRKENERILDLVLALFQQFLLQTPINLELFNSKHNQLKRKSIDLRILATPVTQSRKQEFKKPSLLLLECIYGCLQILSSFPQIYEQVIPSVQNYVAVMFMKWNQLRPSKERQADITDLFPLFMKLVRPWHQNSLFSIQSLAMKTHNFKFGILNYHYKKNLGDKSFILSGLDKLRRKAKTMSASVLNRLMIDSRPLLTPQRFQSDGASFVYESLLSYQEQIFQSRSGSVWLHHAKNVTFPFTMKIFPLILKSGCFSSRHISLRNIEFLWTFIEFIKPDQNGTIFDGYFSLQDSLNHFQNPPDLIPTVLNLQNQIKHKSQILPKTMNNKFHLDKDCIRESAAIRRGYKRTIYPFRVQLDLSERDEILSIVKKLQDVKVSQQLKQCLGEVNAKLNKKNIKTLREYAERVKNRYMEYFKVSEIIPSRERHLSTNQTNTQPQLKLKRSPSFGNQEQFKLQSQEVNRAERTVIMRRSRENKRYSVWFETAHRNESELVLRVARKCSFLCDKVRGMPELEYPETNLRFLANRNLWALGGLLFLTGAWFFI